MNDATQKPVPEDALKVGDKVIRLHDGYSFQCTVQDIIPCCEKLPRSFWIAVQTQIGHGYREMRTWNEIKQRWEGNIYRMPIEAPRLLEDAKAMLDDLRNTIRIAEQAIYVMEEQSA